MKLIVYSSEDENSAQMLLDRLEGLVPQQALEMYGSVEHLADRLRRPCDKLTVAILFARTREELSVLLGHQELLSDLRIVLILPSPEKRMIAQAHKFGPRFLAYADTDWSDVRQVLNRMFERSGMN